MSEIFSIPLHSFWFMVGFVLLLLELVILGLTTGFFLFLGLAALVTGGLLYFGSIPPSWIWSLAAFSISSVGVSLLLWKPFKRLERSGHDPKQEQVSDLIGHCFRLNGDLTPTTPVTTRYSGIEWQVELDTTATEARVPAGTRVAVVRLEPGRFFVRPQPEEASLLGRVE